MRMRKVIVTTIVALVIGALPALAQQPAAQQPAAPQPAAQQSTAPQPMTVMGELMRVDTTAKTITIKTSANVELNFIYSDDTSVTGDEKTVAGLATLSGNAVRVTYTKKGQDNVATEIAVQKKPAA